MINTKIFKADFDAEKYAELAAWANENGAFIKEYADYYICEEEPTPSVADIKKSKVAEIKEKYEEKFRKDEAALVRARLAGNEKTVEQLQARYKANMLAMANEIKEV